MLCQNWGKNVTMLFGLWSTSIRYYFWYTHIFLPIKLHMKDIDLMWETVLPSTSMQRLLLTNSLVYSSPFKEEVMRTSCLISSNQSPKQIHVTCLLCYYCILLAWYEQHISELLVDWTYTNDSIQVHITLFVVFYKLNPLRMPMAQFLWDCFTILQLLKILLAWFGLKKPNFILV